MQRIIHTTAGGLGLAGFTVASLSGLLAGQAGSQVLVQALVAMAACQAVGMLIGRFGTTVAQEHLRTFEQNNPIPAEEPTVADQPVALDDPGLAPTQASQANPNPQRSSKKAA